MTYTIKEVFYTIQGEGRHAGTPAVFCRFSGCNLWSGKEKDRANAICQFCDTDFVGGVKYKTAELLAAQIDSLWPFDRSNKFVVLTGGEPLLQADQVFFDALHELGFYIAVETNGTVWINPSSVDWLCVSPKAGTNLLVQKGHELKFVYPQADMSPNQFENMDFEVFSIQPMDNKNQAENIKSAIHFCLLNPKWHFSMQVHKIAGIR